MWKRKSKRKFKKKNGKVKGNGNSKKKINKKEIIPTNGRKPGG